MLFCIANILTTAPGIGNSLGESIFVAIITGIVISLFLSLREKRADKEALKLEERENNLKYEKIYYNTLKSIVHDSGKTLFFDYGKTLHQLLEACNPKHYLEPYQPEKIDIATELYSKLRSMKMPYKRIEIRRIRKQANEQLGINLPSQETYNLMVSIFNPKNFIDNNFNAEKLKACTQAYKYIEDNKNDLRKLEQFAYKIGLLKI